MATSLLDGYPTKAPAAPSKPVRYADVAVTPSGAEFHGRYRGGKQHHGPDLPAVLQRAREADIERIMLTGMRTSDLDSMWATAESENAKQAHRFTYFTLGIHPYDAQDAYDSRETSLPELRDAVNKVLATEPEVLGAFGELGLDWDRTEKSSKEAQLYVFEKQLEVLVEQGWDLPLFLHCRGAFEDFVRVITPFLLKLPRRGLVHSFVGTAEQMHELVRMGFDISVNGFSFKDVDSLRMSAEIPLENLQIETDAPWGEITSTIEVAKRYLENAPAMPPSRKKDKFVMGQMVKERNESCAISRIAFVVAGLRGLQVDEVVEAAWRNSTRMFRLDR